MSSEFATMKEIGQQFFGVSSHKVGSVLRDLGYRTTTRPSKPTRKAFEEGMVQQYWMDRVPIYSWMWHIDKTVPLLERAGLKRVAETATPAIG